MNFQTVVSYDAMFSAFILFNWLLCLISVVWLVSIYCKNRYLFIKPSIILLTYTHIFFQWPATIYSGYYEEFLPSALIFSLLIHGYVLVGLLISTSYLRASSKLIYDRIVRKGGEYDVSIKALWLLLVAVVLIDIAYLKYVPLVKTGLYMIFDDPLKSSLAREESLKLLQSPLIKYAYSIMTSSIAPLLTVVTLIAFRNFLKQKRYLGVIFCLSIIGFVLVSVSLTGARVAPVNVFVVIAMALIIKNGFRIKPIYFVVVGAIILTPAVLLTILREGESIDKSLLLKYCGLIAGRIFVTPLNVGSWYVHYAQTHGLFGIGAVSKIATLFGEQAMDIPHFIANEYAASLTDTTSAVGGYLFTYYSYFGILSIILSLMGLWLLDVAVVVYKTLDDRLLIPCMAAILLSTLQFISTEYTIVLFTHGFGVILILSLMLNAIIRRKCRMYDPAISLKRSICCE